MQQPEVRASLDRLAASLNGIDFNLGHRASLLPAPSSTPCAPHAIYEEEEEAMRITTRRRSSSLSRSKKPAEAVYSRRAHDEVRLQYGTLSAVSQLLQASPVEFFEVPPRDSLRREIQLPASLDAASSVVVWQFEVVSYDVGFEASFERGTGAVAAGDDEEALVEVQPWSRVAATGRPMEGWFRVPSSSSSVGSSREGRLVLTWDNGYSLRRSKDVSLRIALVRAVAFEAALVSARDEMMAAIWQRLGEASAAEMQFQFPPKAQRSSTPFAHRPADMFASPSISRESSYDETPSTPLFGMADGNAFNSSDKQNWRNGASGSLVVNMSVTVLMGGRAVSLEECNHTGIPDTVLAALIPSSSSSTPSMPRTPRTPSSVWSYLPGPTSWRLSSSPSTPSSISSSLSAVRSMACGMCAERFNLFRRSHRCRRCQDNFCLPCSRHYAVLEGTGTSDRDAKPQRVCDRCFVNLKDRDQFGKLAKDRSLSLSSSTPSLCSRTSSFGLEDTEGGNKASAAASVLPPPTPPSSSESAPPDPALATAPYEALKLKPEMQMYFKMLAVGVPVKAVTQKMAADGVDAEAVQIFSAGKAGMKVSPTPASAEPSAEASNPKHQPQSGRSSSASSSGRPPLRRSSSSSSTGSHLSSSGGPVLATASFKLRAVHFERLTPERAEKSVFKRKSSVAQSTETAGGGSSLSSALSAPSQGQHVKELAELFSVTQHPKLPLAGTGTGAGKKGRPAFGAALDARRLQNVGIVYNYFKKSFSSSEALVVSVLGLERDRLPVERLPGLLDILPNAEEQKKLVQAAGYTHELVRHAPAMMPDGVTPYSPTPPVPLHEAELFMLATMTVPRMGAKVRCFHFWQAFQESGQALDAKIQALAAAFKDVVKSDRLVRVLEVLLYLGNILNAYSGSSSAGVVVEAFTIDSLFRVALTKSTTSGDTTLLDYFVRLAAEKGEGAILNVVEDMPTLSVAAALPDCSAVLRDVRTWLRDFDALKHEIVLEEQDLATYAQARIGRQQAQQQAEEARRAAAEAAREAELQRKIQAARREAERQEDIRALTERLAMEKEDATPYVGEHYLRYLEEAEEEFDGGKGDGVLWADVLAVLHASGPPLPLELKIGLLLRQKPSRMDGRMMEEEEVSDEAFYDAQQEENEDEVEGIKGLNEELGSSQGDDAAQQRLLRAASRWLGSRLKVTKCLALLQGTTKSATAAASFTSAPAIVRPAIPLDGRSALLAALRGRGGGGSSRGRGRGGGGRGRTLGAVSMTRGNAADDLRVLYEAERGAFVQNLTAFVASTEARIQEVAVQGGALEKQSRSLYEYFGEDPGTASSARILSTIWKFLQRLGQSKRRYEQRHGLILTPEMLEEEEIGNEAEPVDDLAISTSSTSISTSGTKITKKRRRRSSLPPLMVGQRLLSVYGPGVVEAVRVKDRTCVLRFTTWNATGYLNAGALIGSGTSVTTPFGDGVVEDVQRQIGTYQVRLPWGALLYTPNSGVKAAVVSRK